MNHGAGQQLAGFNEALNQTTNVYQLEDASKQNTGSNLLTVTNIGRSFITETLQLGEDSWKILEKSSSLRGADSGLKDLEDYRQENEQSYVNIVKLAPFLDRKAVLYNYFAVPYPEKDLWQVWKLQGMQKRN